VADALILKVKIDPSGAISGARVFDNSTKKMK
jgi:hypothetical protein